MRATSKLLALALAAALQPAVAAPVTLTFEGLTSPAAQSWAPVASQYVDQGVTFSGTGGFADSGSGGCTGAWSLILPRSSTSCGYLLLGSKPSLADNDPKTLTINVDGGFDGLLSFYFAVQGTAGLSVVAYDDTGNSVGTAAVANAQTCSLGYAFCNWQKAEINLQGTATSIVIKGQDNFIALDDLFFNRTSASGNNPLPEPGSIALALGALAGAGIARRRRAR